MHLSPSTTSPLNLNEYDELRCIIPPALDEIDSVRFVQIGGTRFNIGIILALTLSTDLPIFGKISYILLDPKDSTNVYFIGKKLQSIKFNQFYEAYEVVESLRWFFVPYEQLFSICPTHIRHAVARENYW